MEAVEAADTTHGDDHAVATQEARAQLDVLTLMIWETARGACECGYTHLSSKAMAMKKKYQGVPTHMRNLPALSIFAKNHHDQATKINKKF